MGLPDPHDVAAYDVALAKVAVGPVEPPLTGRIVVSDYDPAWPQRYEREAGRVRSALGDLVVSL
jgi:GrpB-like predicted nucleotidyltransferase (UPF0157 family)